MARITGSLGADPLDGTAANDLMLGHPPLDAATTTPAFTTLLTGGLGTALFATAAPGDDGRLYVLAKEGLIRTVDTTTGTVSGLFLNLSAEVGTEGEQGLLGLAFHPEFWANGKVYVFFSRLDGDTQLREYTADPANPDRVLAGSARDILTIPEPGSFTNHKGGWIGFGPDGMLSIAVGDGGGGGDPTGTGQNPNDLLGSILRIDVDRDDFPADASRNYGIPGDNPFVDGGGAPEVWAYGLRNPFRDSFDRGDGSLWIADVGQATWEEVNIGVAGGNYGWVAFEGPGGPAPGILFPDFAYDHGDGDRSIIGGYAHRGPDSGLQGQYIFGDFGTGRIWRLADFDGDGTLDRQLLDAGGLMGANTLSSFAEDAEGRIYAIGLNGKIARLDAGLPTGPDQDGADTINGRGGDDHIYGGAGNDVLRGAIGDDVLSGMEGQDMLVGGEGRDTLFGGAGRDTLLGGAGDDLLVGGAGADRLVGGNGRDLLFGGAGADVLLGGGGADRFRWTSAGDSGLGAAADRVMDFSAAEGDVLDFSALVAGRFAFIGTAAFDATGAQVRLAAQGGATRVEISLDGGPADMAILVFGDAPLTVDAFIL